MGLDKQLIFFILNISAALSVVTAYLLYKRKSAPGALYFTATAVSCLIWTIGYIIEFMGEDIETKMWGVRLQYFFGIPFVSTFWFVAAIHYNSSNRISPKHLLLWINIIPSITMILMWTNNLHHLMYKSVDLYQSNGLILITKKVGFWYFVNVAYSYLGLITGSIILLFGIKRTNNFYRRQIIIYVIACILPWVANALYLAGMNSFMRIDITPIAFSITMLLVWVGLFKYQLFDIVPAAKNIIIDTTDNGFIVIDGEDRVIEANPAAQKIFDNKILIGTKKEELFKDLKIKWDVDLSKQSEVFEIEHGENFYEMVVKELNNNNLKYNGKVLAFYNITERKNTESKLHELNAAKDKLFSIIAHDLKNPFFGIIGLSEILLEDYSLLNDKEKLDLINNLNELSHNTYKMLENLLDWARQQTGNISFSQENFDLTEIIQRNIQIVKQQAEFKNIKLIYELSDKIQVFADEHMIDTVVRNLISNAIKFTHNGGQIEINAEVKSNKAYVSVKDSGIGMSEETLNKLFNVESTIKSTGTAGEHGTGLGLILCKEFVEKNKGQIEVKSQTDQGSTFIFSVPCTK